jgi:DnaK suppressor protein
MYSKEFLDKMQSRLLEQKEALEKEIKETNPYPEYDTESSDDVAEKLEADANNEGVIEQLKDELSKVNAALTRIENGTYGLAHDRSTYISEERLEVLPWAEDSIDNEPK